MFCWRGVTPNVIPDSILGSKPSDSDSSTTTRRGDCAHGQPYPHPTPPGHTNHQRDRNTGLRTSRLGRAALHHLRHLRLPLPRRPPQATRPLPQLDPQGRRQDHHPTPQRRAAGPLPALVPSPPTPTRATHRTRDPLPGDHRDRTATSGRPQKAQPQTATKNTAHLDLPAPYAARIASLRRLMDDLDFEINLFAGIIRGRLAKEPGYTAVQNIPGIGPTLGAVLVAEIGDVSRFASASKLTCWAGLTPKHHESDTHVRRGRITKQGSRLVRWAAIEAVKTVSKGSVVGV